MNFLPFKVGTNFPTTFCEQTHNFGYFFLLKYYYVSINVGWCYFLVWMISTINFIDINNWAKLVSYEYNSKIQLHLKYILSSIHINLCASNDFASVYHCFQSYTLKLRSCFFFTTLINGMTQREPKKVKFNGPVGE